MITNSDAWEAGELIHLLHDCQEPLYDEIWAGINNPDCLKYAVNCSRRFGKTTVLLLIAVEFCIRHPGSYVRFFTKHHNMMSQIIEEVGAHIFRNAPLKYRPQWKGGQFHFNNGSKILVAGLDDQQHNAARGRASDLVIIDEAGFINRLEYIYKSVILPTTMTTKGTVIFSSSPGDSPAQDFSKIVAECELKGFYSCYTIDDNTMVDEVTKRNWIEEAGGEDSSFYKREYLCQFVTDETKTIIKEWKDEFVREFPKDEFYKFNHKYVACDLGVVHFTACLFGYYDFKKATLVIEDEITMNGKDFTTKLLADSMLAKEKQLWGDPLQPAINPTVYKRVADNNNLLMINDFVTLHGMSLVPTNKEERHEMFNEVRLYVMAGRIIVHPRCKQLIGCLKYGIWDKRHKKFDVMPLYGHFDHLAALVYLIRNLDYHTNPVPNNYNYDKYTMYNPPSNVLQAGTSLTGVQLSKIFDN